MKTAPPSECRRWQPKHVSGLGRISLDFWFVMFRRGYGFGVGLGSLGVLELLTLSMSVLELQGDLSFLGTGLGFGLISWKE